MRLTSATSFQRSVFKDLSSSRVTLDGSSVTTADDDNRAVNHFHSAECAFTIDGAMCEAPPLQSIRTRRFAVLQQSQTVNHEETPIVHLSDLLLHAPRGVTAFVRQRLYTALNEQGYCFLIAPNDSKPARVVEAVLQSLWTDLFPPRPCPNHKTITAASITSNNNNSNNNAARLATSDQIYVSEKGTPMYRLGYELAEDGMREVFRVSAGACDDVSWKNDRIRATWLRGLSLLRQVTDTALDLLLPFNHCVSRRPRRPASSSSMSWRRQAADEDREDASSRQCCCLPKRPGDFSMLYAMHYFNHAALNDDDNDGNMEQIVCKAHVDPSLLVVEPFLCRETIGLQVWNRKQQCWMNVDGADSPTAPLWDDDHVAMLLIVGKAMKEHCGLEPTLHRVIRGTCPRRTVIYEQKYAEFYPLPSFD